MFMLNKLRSAAAKSDWANYLAGDRQNASWARAAVLKTKLHDSDTKPEPKKNEPKP